MDPMYERDKQALALICSRIFLLLATIGNCIFAHHSLSPSHSKEMVFISIDRIIGAICLILLFIIIRAEDPRDKEMMKFFIATIIVYDFCFCIYGIVRCVKHPQHLLPIFLALKIPLWTILLFVRRQIKLPDNYSYGEIAWSDSHPAGRARIARASERARGHSSPGSGALSPKSRYIKSTYGRTLQGASERCAPPEERPPPYTADGGEHLSDDTPV